MKKELDGKLKEILAPHGFVKVRNFHIRLINEVVQTVAFIYTPSYTEGCRGYYLDFGMASIYDHFIFGIIEDTHGYLNGTYTVDMHDFCTSIQNKSRTYPKGYNDDSQLEEFKELCLPFLNSVSSLEDLYKARIVMQTIFNKNIRYHLSPDTNLCLKIGKYDEAAKRIYAAYDYYCEAIQEHNWPHYNNLFSNAEKLKQLIESGDRSLIEAHLENEKKKNIELYQSILPKRKRKTEDKKTETAEICPDL